MAYKEKTDWLPDDPITEDDVNRWEKGIKEAHTDLAAHKNDLNNPHGTTKAQIGLGNVENVQQASKAEFNRHVGDETIHITAEERAEWNAKETPSAAQEKADRAEENAKTYADQTFTNEKLTVLPDSEAIQDARTAGSEYPLGITLIDIGQGNKTGYPLSYGFVKNEKRSNYRFTQYFYGTANETGDYYYNTGTWIRHWWNESGWTQWEKISGFAHANIGTTGRQALIRGELQKIKFNRIIKDSHKLFDTKNNRFKASHSGMYLVGASLYIENSLQYSNFELYVYKNGAKYKLMNRFIIPSPKDNSDSTEFHATVTGTVNVPLDEGDYIEIYVYAGYSGSKTRYIMDSNGVLNYFDILELGGRNYRNI
ncbi:hypothetical protein M8181_14990 [Bacillus licheniformis]|nr:hypothetical protein LXN06_15070 [Bacillus licheniformis]WIY55353.1 hypothetical protein M8181_14990 [Bacillus licheniformis]